MLFMQSKAQTEVNGHHTQSADMKGFYGRADEEDLNQCSSTLSRYKHEFARKRPKEEEASEDSSLNGPDQRRTLEKHQMTHFRVSSKEKKAFDDDKDPLHILHISEIDSFIHSLRYSCTTTKSEWTWLNFYIRSPKFRRSYGLYDNVADVAVRTGLCDRSRPKPVAAGAEDMLAEVLCLLEHFQPIRSMGLVFEQTHQVRELENFLNRGVVQHLVITHDILAEHWSSELENQPYITKSTASYSFGAPQISGSMTSLLPGCYATFSRSEKGILLKTVVLQKGDEPLGATVRNEGSSVVVGRVVIGGVAYKSGLIKEGDEILSVNSIDIMGKDVNNVSDILTRMKGPLTFVMVPANDAENLGTSNREVEYHLRALFTYNPEEDMFIPCKEIGLAFNRGDILHVINTCDPNWWQAYRDGAEAGVGEGLAGIIPSPEFQQQREIMRHVFSNGIPNAAITIADPERQSLKPLFLRKLGKKEDYSTSSSWGRKKTKRRRKWKRKQDYFPANFEEIEAGGTLTYESVELYRPPAHCKRPLVLLGPPKVGRHELLLKAIEEDVERFSPVIPHTTRLCLLNEVDGKDYHFVTKSEFQSLLDNNEFVEYGVFEKHWYGTSKSAIRSVVAAEKICILSLQPESLKAIRRTGLFPYIIFVSSPPDIEPLQKLRMELAFGVRPPDEELYSTIERGKIIEQYYGHFFDAVIVNNDLYQSHRQLLDLVDRLDTEPQWVPKEWLTE